MQGGVDPLSSPQDGALDGGGGSPCRVLNLKNGRVACNCR